MTCGLHARSRAHDGVFLRAGHVKPWRDASSHERLDPANGLALCVTHDRAFEAGLVTLDEDLRLVLSPRARESFEPDSFGAEQLERWHGRRLLHEDGAGALKPGTPYLQWHRETVYESFLRGAASA